MKKAQPEDNLNVISSKNIDKALAQIPTLFCRIRTPVRRWPKQSPI